MVRPIPRNFVTPFESFATLRDYYYGEQHSILSYVIYAAGSEINSFAAITHIQILSELAANGDKPFYAADLLGSCESLGGWVNALRCYGIIRPTGNSRTCMVQLGKNKFRECVVKEWKLNYSVESIRAVVDSCKMHIMAIIREL